MTHIATKWPQMIVTGTPVSVDQAKEIIRRTDVFFRSGDGGNNHEYQRKICDMLKIYPESALYSIEDVQQRLRRYDAVEKLNRIRLRKWRYIETEFVRTNWISCCFVGGPHGWCHPDGTIGYIDNIGKWPSFLAVLREWEQLAKAFPFLDLIVELVEDEGDGKTAGFIRVCNGKAEESNETVAESCFERFPVPSRRTGITDRDFDIIGFAITAENGISDEWIADWADLTEDLKI